MLRALHLLRFALPLLVAAVVFESRARLAATDVPGQSAAEVGARTEGGGEEGAPRSYQLREGDKIVGALGEFLRVDSRIQFSPADGAVKLTVLENRAAERVYRALAENRKSRQWSVSGVVTEFRGKNFLLVTKAVLRPRVDEDQRAAGVSR